MNRLLICAVLCLVSFPVLADSAAVKRLAESQLMLGDKIEHILRSPYAGLYEVDVRGPEGPSVYYVNPSATLIFSGQIIDARSGRNLTQERIHALNAIHWASLPFKLAFTNVRGTGQPSIAVFTDPNCPYCRRFERTLTQIKNITVYTFLYPTLEPTSKPLANAVWCSKDPAKAWEALMLDRRPPKAVPNCNAPLGKLIALGRSLDVTTTPTWFLQNGDRHQGTLSRSALAALLEENPN